MSSNMGLLLSFLILIPMLLFCGDLACLSSIHNELDALSLTVSYQISASGGLTDEIKEFVNTEAGASIKTEGDTSGLKFGDALSFVIMKEYNSFIISSEPMMVTVQRTAIIGYII